MDTYRVTAVRHGSWWSLVAHDVGGREVASQSRRLDQTDGAIREAIALVLDPASFSVEVAPDLASVPMSNETREALKLRRALSELSERVHLRTPAAVAELRGAGLSVRDVAPPRGHRLARVVTASRVSQIEQREATEGTVAPPAGESLDARRGAVSAA